MEDQHNVAREGMPHEERRRKSAETEFALKVPEWMREYESVHPDVDFRLYSIVRWKCVCAYVEKRFGMALVEGDGDLLRDPDVAEALWMLADEPMEIMRVLRGLADAGRHGGDFAAEKTLVESFSCIPGYEPESPRPAFVNCFNEAFIPYGIAIARWVAYTDSLDTSPYFADIKRRIATLDLMSGEPRFPDPFDVEDFPDEIPEYMLESLDLRGVKCAGIAFKELILLARQVSGYGRESGDYPRFKKPVKGVGKWASKWVTAYDPKNRHVTFLGVDLNFSNAPKRWETVSAVVESRAEQGEVMLGHAWRGAWQTMRKDEFNLSRYIHPLDRRLKRGGWYHLTEKPMPDIPVNGR